MGHNSIKTNKAIKGWNKTTKKLNFILISFSNKVNMLDRLVKASLQTLNNLSYFYIEDSVYKV